MVQVTDEDVDEMVAMFKISGVHLMRKESDMREWIRTKLEANMVHCFEQEKWVKREDVK